MMGYRLILFWTRLSLAQQFALASLVVLVAGMAVVGWWVSKKIEAGVIQNTAVSAALYLTSFVAPEVQELAQQDRLSAESIAALDRLYNETPLRERIASFKIWGPEGRVVYGNHPAIIGQVFPLSPNQMQAWNGTVAVAFDGLDQAENILERGIGIPLVEIYSPVRERWSNRIIAVAEFYDTADALVTELIKTRIESWLVVAGVTFSMFALLFGIVRRGSQTIVRQQYELQARIQQLSTLLVHNQALHDRAQRATSRAVELNERFLRRISAELHDGPAQALGFALLRLDAAMTTVGGCSGGNVPHTQGQRDLDTIRRSLREALQDIRSLSAGLAMPELAELTLAQLLQRVVRTHQRRTGTGVELRLDGVPEHLPLPLKIGLYRFVQEALNNAYRHGGGLNQQVQACCAEAALEITVSDGGPGFDPAQRPDTSDQLGLSGMRERIESLGGGFQLDSAPGQGTRVIASLPLGALETDHAR